MRIAILFHEKDRHRNLSRYDIMHIAKYWQQAGHEVITVFGTKKLVPADVAFLHIDLSVVPQNYVDFAEHYPVCLNKDALDIRKSTISRQLLRQGDDYNGQVIIKSNNNTAGIPERINADWGLRIRMAFDQGLRRLRKQSVIRRASDYRILDNLSQVPRHVYARKDLVVEKFLPERKGEFYCQRTYLFLGDAEACQLSFSKNPIVSWSNRIKTEPCNVHPDVMQWRHKLGFDYGKFDYVIHHGEAILLDANKTTGSGDSVGDPMVEKDRRTQADGLLRYYERLTSAAKAQAAEIQADSLARAILDSV